jgi:hypothetical protein
MSIVLVIIGLIIGGILKGQEIIASARQKAVINQVNAVRSAANTYFDRYRALPGDDAAGQSVDGQINNGNGDGIVGSSVSGIDLIASTASNTGENYQFFNALIATNLLNGGQAGSSTSGTSFGHSALPAAPISGSGMEVIYGVSNGVKSKTGHWIRVQKNPSTAAAAMSPRTMSNIDTQIDDGVAGNGGVRASNGNSGDTTCNSSNSYVAGDDVTCIGVFEQ